VANPEDYETLRDVILQPRPTGIHRVHVLPSTEVGSV
jgi:hypothetical protein